jgi:hypothetical protein
MTFLKQMMFADWYHAIIGALGIFGTRYVCLYLNGVRDEAYFVPNSGIDRLFANLVDLLQLIVATFGGFGSVIMIIAGLMSFYSKRYNEVEAVKRELQATQYDLLATRAKLEERKASIE